MGNSVHVMLMVCFVGHSVHVMLTMYYYTFAFKPTGVLRINVNQLEMLLLLLLLLSFT